MRVLLFIGGICSCDGEFFAENVGQFGAKTIPTPGYLLYAVIIVARCQHVAENQLWHIYFFFSVHLDRNAFSIVPDCDSIFCSVNRHLNHCHLLVAVKIVSCIDNDLIYMKEKRKI